MVIANTMPMVKEGEMTTGQTGVAIIAVTVIGVTVDSWQHAIVVSFAAIVAIVGILDKRRAMMLMETLEEIRALRAEKKDRAAELLTRLATLEQTRINTAAEEMVKYQQSRQEIHDLRNELSNRPLITAVIGPAAVAVTKMGNQIPMVADAAKNSEGS